METSSEEKKMMEKLYDMKGKQMMNLLSHNSRIFFFHFFPLKLKPLPHSHLISPQESLDSNLKSP